MEQEAKQLYTAISTVINKVKSNKGITYTDLCAGNDIPQSTYDDIINAKTKASFYNIAKVLRALDLNFEEFGRLLDEELPDDFLYC